MSDSMIKIGMDVSSVKTQIADFTNAIETGNQAVVKLFKTMATADQFGNPIKLIVEGLHTDGTKMRAELLKIEEGWVKAQFAVDKASKAMAESRERNTRSASVGTDLARNALIPQGFEAGSGTQAASIEANMNRIKKALEDGKISIADFDKVLRQVQQNPKGILGDLDAEQTKVAKAIRSIIAEVEKSNKAKQDSADKAEAAANKEAAAAKKAADAVTVQKARTEAATKAENDLRAAIAAPKTIDGVRRYETAINKVKQAIESGKVSYERFQELLAKVKGNPTASIAGLNLDEQKVVNALRGIQGELDNTGTKSKSLFITWDGIFRLMQAQVIKRLFSEFQSQILQSIATAKQFSIAIAEIQTISRDAGYTTDQWRAGLTELSNQFGNSQADVAEAAYQALSNQVGKAADVFTFVGTAQKFAQATNSTVEQSVNLLSSAIKSFRLEAGEADRIAAIFFKTIELGKVRAKDMSNTFGRIGVIASELGVKLEEVAAGVATVTVKGTNFADSSVLMTNLLQKLLRPTTEMKELFKEWGVETGEQAIRTFGFVGTLQRLEVEAQKGSNRLGDLLTNVRAVRGGFNFTGEGLKEFQKNLSQITQGQKEYEAAISTVGESTGRQIQIEIQKIKNMFVNEFGEEVIKVLLKFRDGLREVGFKDFADAIAFTINVAKNGAQVWLVYRASLIAYSAATATATVATTAFGTALAATTAIVGPFLVAFGAGFLFDNWVRSLNLAGEAVESIADKFERLGKTQSQLRFDALSTDRRASDNKLVNDIQDQLESKFQVILQFSAKLQSQLNGARKSMVSNLKEATDAMKLSSKTYFDELGNRVKDFQEKINQAKQAIRDSRRFSEELPRKLRNDVYDTKSQYASEGRIDPISGFVVDEQRIGLIKQRLLETIAAARAEAAKGTKEGFDESNKLFDEAARRQKELFDAETNLKKRNFEEAAKRGLITPTRYGLDGSPEFEFRVQTIEFERQQKALMEERLKIQEQIRISKVKEIELAQQALAAEKEKKRELQQQFDKLEKLKFYNDQGEIDRKYKGPGGIEKARADFEAIEKRIRELAGSDSASGQYQIFADLQKQKLALLNELAAAERQENITTARKKLEAEADGSKKLAEERKTALAAYQSEISRRQVELARQLDTIEKNTLASRPFDSKKVLGVQVLDFSKANAAEPARQEALARLKLVKEAQDAFSKDQTPAKAKALEDAIADLNLKIAEYTRLRTGVGPAEVRFGGDDKTPTDRSTALAEQAESIRRISESANVYKNLITESEQKIRDLNTAILDIQTAWSATATGVKPSIESMIADIQRLATKVEETMRRMSGLPGADIDGWLDSEKKRIDAEGKMFGGPVKYMSTGGMVGFVPRGSDQVPAMIGRDEFVMTGAATRKFLPILKAMNAGTFRGGVDRGSTTTNVGDININMQAGSTNSDTVRDLAARMRRGIRRGTISLEK